MTTEIKRLIRVRVEKGATFKRDGYGKKAQLCDSWRKPRGQHNKQREQKKDGYEYNRKRAEHGRVSPLCYGLV